jgi:hypothetical protein
MAALIDIPNIVDIWTEMEGKPDGSMDAVVVVVTDLELDALHPQHDKAKVDALIEALGSHMQRNPNHIDKIRLTTRRG